MTCSNGEKPVQNEEIQALLTRGSEQLTNAQYTEALQTFTEAIKLDPENAYHYSLRAWTYKELGDCQNALADLEKANQLEPTDKLEKEIGETKELLKEA